MYKIIFYNKNENTKEKRVPPKAKIQMMKK